MYFITTPDGNETSDRYEDGSLSHAKTMADYLGNGAKVFRYNVKTGKSKARVVYVSDVIRPTNHIWMGMDAVVTVLEHFLSDRGLDFMDMVNLPNSAREDLDQEFQRHSVGFGLFGASMKIAKK